MLKSRVFRALTYLELITLIFFSPLMDLLTAVASEVQSSYRSCQPGPSWCYSPSDLADKGERRVAPLTVEHRTIYAFVSP